MKIDATKTKKCCTEVPSDCKELIDKLIDCDENGLQEILGSTIWWTVGKCELFHWIDVLNRFDGILQSACQTSGSEWSLAVNTDENLQKLTLSILHFTSLLIEYSFSRHLYNSMEHLVALLSSSNLDIILSVLNLLYVFSKRSNFLSRLSDKQRLPLLKRMGFLAENWGGKENGFGLADAAKDLPKSQYPHNATTLHYEFYSEPCNNEKPEGTQSTVYCIHIENVDELQSNPAQIMESLLEIYPVPEDKRMLLYTHLRLAHSFSRRDLRLKCIQARLHAISVLVYMNSLQTTSSSFPNILYNGFIEELVDILQVDDEKIVDIKAAALRTLTSIVHLECRDRTPRVSTVVDATGVAQYHGFLPVLVRRCIKKMTEQSSGTPEFTPNFTTALFSFLYHLSSYENGGEALLQSGMMGPLLTVVVNMGDQQEQTTFVTRAVRVIDLITNVEWQAFQSQGGLQTLINRLQHEVDLCRKDTVEDKKGVQCQPQRAALFKSILNFLKKAMSDHVFGDEVRHIMDGTLPNSLKHLVDNVEYYGPSLFLLAMEVVTVYVFQEPSLLSVLQNNGITDAMLHALLVKDPPATREVLASLPNIFSALCLNSCGLEAFVNHKPFDRLFKVLMSPNYLLAMRTRRGTNPVDRDTASNLGNAMDELMRHQPTLRSAAMKAIINLLHQLVALGSDPNTVCTRPDLNILSTSSSFEALLTGGDDTESEDEDAGASQKPAALAQTFAATENKQPVPLLEYIHNVMKFIQAIVSNNATDDHCQEFQNHGGLPILFKLLHLPALPLDFPSSPACQSVANLVKSILTLSKKAQVFTDGVIEFNEILTLIESIHFPISEKRDESIWQLSNGSVILYELAAAAAGSDPLEIPLVQTLVHAHAFIMVFLHVSRTSQTDIRNLLISNWAEKDVLVMLTRLNKLYCSLIWEATMLMNFCPKTDETEVSESTAKLRKLLSSKYSRLIGQTRDTKQKGEAMEEDGKVQGATPWNAYQKVVRSVVLAASRLGRSMAELFGLLAKLSIGLPPRLRYRHNQPFVDSSPAKAASHLIAGKLSELLKMGMEWSPPCQEESTQFRTTFLNCIIGFTMDMLFDDRKSAYHLMLQYFQRSEASQAFFRCFDWALNSAGLNESTETPQDLRHAVTFDVFCQIWLGLLEHLVNPKNILESPHSLSDAKFPNPKSKRQNLLDPVEFLVETHSGALEALRKLWLSKKLETLSASTHDIILLTLCNIIEGEKLVKRRLKKKKVMAETPIPQVQISSRTSNINAEIAPNPNESENFQQLLDMGFPRARVAEALTHNHNLEAATEWILSRGDDADLMQAITMSLQTVRTPGEETIEEKNDNVASSKDNSKPEASVESEKNFDKYLSGEEINSFIEEILQKCPSLLDIFPNSVYRVYEFYEAIMKRNGPEWAGRRNVFKNLLQEISSNCDSFLQNCSSPNALEEEGKHEMLSSRCLLLSLLFQGHQFSDVCARALHENNIIEKILLLLQAYCKYTYRKKPEKCIPWVPSSLLLIDLYERSCVHKHRLDALEHYKDHSRTWKWFDDRSGRWCNYSPTNQKILDDAYREGLSKIQFTASRRKYCVNFQHMLQVNEDSASRRPVMFIFNKPRKIASGGNKMSITAENQTDAMDMETDVVIDENSELGIWNGLSQQQSKELVEVCATLIKSPINGDTIHAAMRLLLRLTRSDKPGGLERAKAFVKLGGPQSLLSMTKKNEFPGYTSLATLIICHVFEDSEMLKYAMEKTVRVAASRGVPRQANGVSPVNLGNRELYYVLQALAPMACRHSKTFVDACKTHLRVRLPSIKSLQTEEEENKLMSNNAVQILEPVKESDAHSKIKPVLNEATKEILQLLLNALITIDKTKKSDVKATSHSTSSIVANQLRKVADDINRRYSESESVSSQNEHVLALRQSSVAPDTAMDEGQSQSHEMEEVFYSNSPEFGKPSQKKGRPEDDEDKLLFTKSAVLRLLAELVSSYPSCANYIIFHHYPAGLSPLIKYDSSCLSFILHSLLPPCTKSHKKENLNHNDTNKGAQTEKDSCSSLSRVLITSLVCCNPKSSTQCLVIGEIRSCLHKVLLMPESTVKHNALRALLGLISNMMECASKMSQGNEKGESGVMEDPMSLARTMINKGLATDLAQVPNYIDLGSPNMAETVNAALKPLEVLSRLVHSSAPSTPKPSRSAKSDDTGSSASEPQPNNSTGVTFITAESSMPRSEFGDRLMDEQTDSFEMEGNVDIHRSTETFDLSQEDVSDDSSESMVEDYPRRGVLSMDSQGQGFSHDLTMSENTDDVEEVDMQVVGSGHVEEDNEDQESCEDPTEDLNNEDQDLEDDGSEMDDIDDEDDDDEDDDVNLYNPSYETFVYDLLSETSDNGILLQLEDVLSDGFFGRLPQQGNPHPPLLFSMPVTFSDGNSGNSTNMPSSWYIPSVHPMLTRPRRVPYTSHTNPSRSLDARPTASYTVTANGSSQTVQIEFTSNSDETPQILSRLLGRSASAGIVQLNDSLYSDGSGQTQLLVNSNNIRLMPYNRESNESSLQDHPSNHICAGRTATGSLSILPTALSRWTQTCEILESDSTQYCFLATREEILETLVARRNEDIKERQAKRALEKKKDSAKRAFDEESSKKEKNSEEATEINKAPLQEESQEVEVESGHADISTPTNTPIATRPESPAGHLPEASSSDADAIDALQQASSSLQSVSLSSNHEDEEVVTDVQMPLDEEAQVSASNQTVGTTGEIPVEQESIAANVQADTRSTEIVPQGPSVHQAQAPPESAAAASSEQINEFEGVDPSFLAALPHDIRQEVIREQLSRQGNNRATSSGNQTGGVSPEFLAALPPSIQQEVLVQVREERARAEQRSSSANDPVDPLVFIQTLPSNLRQSVLADMDDSVVALLPANLAAEAQELRANYERRQQRYIRDHLRSGHGSTMMQRINMASRFRLPTDAMWRSSIHHKSSKQQNQQNVKLQVRQLLSRNSLACLLLLLFVEEPKLNLTRLHRVLRNLCFHAPTKRWLVSTLIAILQHSRTNVGGDNVQKPEEAMDCHTTPTKLEKQKPSRKKTPSSISSDHKNWSWLSIKLDAALGSRASIFHVVKPSNEQEIAGATGKGLTNADCGVHIHPQATPIVCRHILDTMLFLVKFFPQHFVSASLHPDECDGSENKQIRQVRTDFWDILLNLDSSSFSSDLTKKNASDEKHVQDSNSRDIELTCMGELMRMLSYPLIKRSQQLTDHLLRLLAQISLHLSAPSKSIGETKSAVNKTLSNDHEGVEKKTNSSVCATDEPQQTATMGARASTSNTSTVGQAIMDTKTATTGSSRSLGSISFPSVSQEAISSIPLEKELELAVQILTSHACSEDGLEDATTLLFHLSKTQSNLRPVIIALLLKGAQEIGGELCKQVVELSRQMAAYLKEHYCTVGNDSGGTPTEMNTLPTSYPPDTSLEANSRLNSLALLSSYDKDKVKKPRRDLQLPIMQALTTKTSNQAFFLRILKVIIQLRKSKKDEKPTANDRRTMGVQGRRWPTLFGSSSAFTNAFVRIPQEEQEAGENALVAILEGGSYDPEPAPGQPSLVNVHAGGDNALEEEEEEEKDPRSLCELLQLDELWENLGQCLKQLEDSNDPHAVLVLQPTVEAFFLVHAPKQGTFKITDLNKDAEYQLSHLEMQPLSPSMSLEASSQPSQNSVPKDDKVTNEAKLFLDFADTHRSILNQILRQSNVPLMEGPFSVLSNHTKVLDFDVKRQHFRQELERLEDNSMSRRDDIAIRVRRQHVFEDSFRELHRRSRDEMKSRLYIVFEGEEGQDAGGLLREWYLIISKEIFNPMYALFRTSPGDRVTYTINPSSYINSNHLSYFKFVGGIVAKAIYDNKLLDCYFTRSFYKHILGKPVRYQDMESEDYAFSQGLVYLLENNVSAIGSELNFSVEIMEFGKTVVRDLKPNGRDLPVTEENKKEYVHLVCQEKLIGAIRQQLSSFLEGFYEIIPKRLISIFDEQELELLISGLPNIDIEDLRNNTEYHKYEPASLQIQWFWRALRSFDQAERAKFLQFVTGTSKVPLQGFAHLEGMTGAQKFQIHRDCRSTSRLPSAHTCFNQLDLPAYESYEKLKQMLLLAINECQEGFGLA